MSGGGGGKPLLDSTGLGAIAVLGAGASVATVNSFWLTATGAGFVADLVTILRGGFATDLTTDLTAGLAGAWETPFEIGLAATFTGAFTRVLTAGLVAGFFTTGLGLTTGWAVFLATGLTTAFEAGLGLTATLTGVLTAGLATDLLAPGLTTFLAVADDFPADLPALADVAGFAFTACLLWDAASG